MTVNRPLGFLPRFSMTLCNGMFVLFTIGGVFLLADNGLDPTPLAGMSEALDAGRPWLSVAILAPAVAVIAFLLTLGSEIDRRCAEDYVYQIVANAALVAVTTTLLSYFAWALSAGLGIGLRPPLSDDFVALLLLSWATGWFTIRARGLVG